jgi:hypothetical protein
VTDRKEDEGVEFIRVGRVGLELIFEPRDMSEFTESRAL